MAHQISGTVIRPLVICLPSLTDLPGICPRGAWEWGPCVGAHMGECSPERAASESLPAPAGCSMRQVRDPQKETAAYAKRTPFPTYSDCSNRPIAETQGPATTWERFISFKRAVYMQWLPVPWISIYCYMCALFCVWTYTHVFICVDTYTVRTSVCRHICLGIYACVCICVYLYVDIYPCVSMWMHTHICVYSHVHVYTCVRVYTCISIHVGHTVKWLQDLLFISDF